MVRLFVFAMTFWLVGVVRPQCVQGDFGFHAVSLGLLRFPKSEDNKSVYNPAAYESHTASAWVFAVEADASRCRQRQLRFRPAVFAATSGLEESKPAAGAVVHTHQGPRLSLQISARLLFVAFQLLMRGVAPLLAVT